MALTARRRRPLDRSKAPRRDARLIIIATEGSDTEYIYFSQFHNSRVQVHTVPSLNGRSAPDEVLSNLEQFHRSYELGNGDELWVAVDVDTWKTKMLGEVATRCRQKKYKLAVSNPCFEVWLALHIDSELPNPTTADSLEKHLKKSLGSFRKSRYDAAKLMPNLLSAANRARDMDLNPGDRWPLAIGTHVYRIVDSIHRDMFPST